MSGIADALAYDEEGRIEIIVDWKSDVEIDAARLIPTSAAFDAYRQQSGARNAILVLMTLGEVMAV